MSPNSIPAGDLIARYVERVLGVRQVEAADSGPLVNANRVTRVCLLIEIGNGSDTPSIQEMGSRLVDAIRNEWLKKSNDNLPQIEWLRADESSWRDAVAEHESNLTLAIVCGVQTSPSLDPKIVCTSSFAEMQGSHVLKREAWRAMQQKIATANDHTQERDS